MHLRPAPYHLIPLVFPLNMDYFERVCVKTSDGLDLSLPGKLVQTSSYLQHLPSCSDTSPLCLPFPSKSIHFLAKVIDTEGRNAEEVVGEDPELYAETCKLADYLGCEEALGGLMGGMVAWAQRSVEVSEEREACLRAAYPWAASYMWN